jgi:hypothetical protein
MKIEGHDNGRYSWQKNNLSCNNLDFCCNIAELFAMNDKFVPNKHIRGNTFIYIRGKKS